MGTTRRRPMKKSTAKIRDDDADNWRPAPVPETSNLITLEKAARTCTACHLYKRATQTVFGEGPQSAAFMLLGEQPGDQEDLAGKPFVGPAGQLLDRALDEAGIKRDEVMSRIPSNTSSESRVGSAAFIKNRTRAKSPRAGPGSKSNCDSLGRSCSFALARLRPNRFSVLPSA
jgi:Uracil DNA glycosylase superfamily